MANFSFGLADLHLHSSFSDGIEDIPNILEYVETRTSLDVIAITDHDTVRGAFLARELVSKGNHRFEVIIGTEVSTRDGHMLALFVESPPPPMQPLVDTVRAVHELGGLCVLAHPMSRQVNSVDRATLERLLSSGVEGERVDGLEVLERRVARIMCTEDVGGLNRDVYYLAEVGGSDAHALSVIASRYTLFPGRTAVEVRRAILERTTIAWSGEPPTEWSHQR